MSQQAHSVEIGTVSVTPFRGEPIVIHGVTRPDFDKLSNMVDAYTRLATVDGQLRSNAQSHVRFVAQDWLGLPHDQHQPRELKTLRITCWTILNVGPWWRRGRQRQAVDVTLRPWLYNSVHFAATGRMKVNH